MKKYWSVHWAVVVESKSVCVQIVGGKVEVVYPHYYLTYILRISYVIVSVCTRLPYVGYSVSEAGAEDDGDLFAGECHLLLAVFEVFVADSELPCGASADDVEREFVGKVAPVPHACAT